MYIFKFKFKFIKENIYDWQAHLISLSDFLAFENLWWKKTDFGIEFYDKENIPDKKKST